MFASCTHDGISPCFGTSTHVDFTIDVLFSGRLGSYEYRQSLYGRTGMPDYPDAFLAPQTVIDNIMRPPEFKRVNSTACWGPGSFLPFARASRHYVLFHT